MRQCIQLFYDFPNFLVYDQIVIIALGVVDEIEWVLCMFYLFCCLRFFVQRRY